MAALSGCSRLSSEPSYLSLTLLNFDSQEHELILEILRADADDYVDAVVVKDQYKLSAPPVDRVASKRVEDEILESDTYIVNVGLEESPATTDTYHFYPALQDDDERNDRLFIEIRTERDSSELYFDFQQNR
ncbi:hypothetical protein [Natrinema gari]|uniref:hypothetical protein n=1 Tax=Natrinema gari TaxID=419186 RepID=UPI000A070DF0|nr:hypothetical protein [Natrinema gari]